MSELDNEIISPAAIFRSLTRLEMKQDQILDGHKRLSADVEKHEDRIRALEKRQWTWAGGLAALIAIVTFSKDFLKGLIQ